MSHVDNLQQEQIKSNHQHAKLTMQLIIELLHDDLLQRYISSRVPLVCHIMRYHLAAQNLMILHFVRD